MIQRALFKGDNEKRMIYTGQLVGLAGNLAQLSSEFYRRYQLEGKSQDLELSNTLHEIVNSIKKVEDKMGEGSALETVMLSRIEGEPGFWGSLFGRSGSDAGGSSQTQNAHELEEIGA